MVEVVIEDEVIEFTFGIDLERAVDNQVVGVLRIDEGFRDLVDIVDIVESVFWVEVVVLGDLVVAVDLYLVVEVNPIVDSFVADASPV